MTATKNRGRFSSAGWRCAVALGLCLGFAPLGCGEGESELLDPGSTRDLDARVDTLEAIPLAADRTFRPLGETGDRNVLLLIREEVGGESVVSTVYLRFGLEGLPDTSGIARGLLSFRVTGGSGDLVQMELFEVAPEAPDWREGSLPREPLPTVEPRLSLQTTPVSGNPDSEDLLEGVLTVPAELLRRWKSDPASNRGLALRLVSDRPGALVLHSAEAVVSVTGDDGSVTRVNTPEIVIERTDQVLRFEPDDDAYLVADARPLEPGDAATLYIDQWIPHRALLLPDLSAVPLEPGDAVHRAELFLRVVAGSIGDADTISIGLFANEGAWSEAEEPDSVLRETFAVDIATVTSATDTLRLDFAPIFQRWVDGDPNYGLTVRAIGEGSREADFRVHAREAPAGQAPWVRVLAVPAPGPRWEDR